MHTDSVHQHAQAALIKRSWNVLHATTAFFPHSSPTNHIPFRSIGGGRAVRGRCGTIQTRPHQILLTKHRFPLRKYVLSPLKTHFKCTFVHSMTRLNSSSTSAKSLKTYLMKSSAREQQLADLCLCLFWIISLQLVCLPQIDPSPIVFCVWPLHAYNWAGPLCSWTTPTLLSPSKWTNMLFPKSEIHLQLLANTSHTDEKVLRAREDKSKMFFFFFSTRNPGINPAE